MKKLYIYIALVLGAILSVGCQKDIDVLTATIEDYHDNNGKVYINDGYACWHNGDEIIINGVSKNIIINKSNGNDLNYNGGQASINVSGMVKPYTAVYPSAGASIDGSNVTIQINPVQNYRVKEMPNGGNVQVVDGLMVGYCDGKDNRLDFLNVGALMAVSIPDEYHPISESINVTSIELIAQASDAYLSGTATINPSVDPTIVITSGEKSNKVVLNIPDGYGEITPTSGKTYYIALPTVKKSSYIVKVNYTKQERINNESVTQSYCFTSNVSGENTILRNKIYKMGIGFNNGISEEIIFEEDGSDTDPYLIESIDDLELLQRKCAEGKTFAGKFFMQTADIVLPSFSGIGYIGTSETTIPFCGNYSGKDDNEVIHTITSPRFGVFNVLGDNAKIHDLNVVYNNPSISGINVGGVVCEIIGDNVEITNCSTLQTLNSNVFVNSASVSSVGGICGKISGKKVLIDKCTNGLDISLNIVNINLGGICGENVIDNEDLSLCTKLSECVNNGKLSSNMNAIIGGIIGVSESNNSSIIAPKIVNIDKCVNSITGTLKQNGGSVHIGGVLGRGSANILNSVNHGSIDKRNANTSGGGLVGEGTDVKIYNSYVDGNLSKAYSVGGVAGKITGTLTINNGYISESSAIYRTDSYLVYNMEDATNLTAINVYCPSGKRLVGSATTHEGVHTTPATADALRDALNVTTRPAGSVDWKVKSNKVVLNYE